MILLNRYEKAIEFRKLLNASVAAVKKLIRVDELTEEELTQIINLYDKYKTDAQYYVGDIFKYNDKLYKVLQDHTSLENWTPSELPALYLSMMPDNIIPEWVQPTGQHDSYMIGDQVIFEGAVYESTIDGNTWSPTAYPQGWTFVG